MNFGTNQILITGANGWLGKTLVNCLLNGISNSHSLEIPQKKLSIKCLVKPNEDIRILKSLSENISIIEGNLNSKEDCKFFTKDSKNAILFHCAGIIHPKKISDFYEINVQGTKNILEEAQKCRIKRAIIISSNSPFGTNPSRNHTFDENSEYNPYLNYGKSKMLMEKQAIKFGAEGRLEIVIIRAPWFYGPFQPPRQLRFYKMIRDGKVPIVGDGQNMRSMACTINISQALIRAAMKENLKNDIFWVSDQNPYSFNEIVNTIRLVMENEFNIECKNRVLRLPNILSETAYMADMIIQGLGFYNQEIHVLSEMNKTIACSIKKASSVLGYQPTHSLYEGTKVSIASALNYMKL